MQSRDFNQKESATSLRSRLQKEILNDITKFLPTGTIKRHIFESKLMMTPKKRVKKKTEEQPKPKSTVPPKKRKVIYENEELELPEWFKTSIQILLINFYQDGVAMLNNVQSDYEAVFKGKTIDPLEYNFPDWEAMLRSDQLKKHCVVYVEKRISYCKGLALSRSAAISMIDGSYKIDPRHLKHDKQAETTTTKPSTITKPKLSVSENEKLDKTESVIQYATDTPSTTGTTNLTVAAIININGSEKEKSGETQSSTKKSSNFQALGKISSLSKSITKPTKSPPARSRRLSEADKTLYEERYNNIENIKAVNSSFKVAVPKPIIEVAKQNETTVIIKPSITNSQENNFFRRSDVPATWTNIIEVETDPPKAPEKEVIPLSMQKTITELKENNSLKKTLKSIGKVTPPPPQSPKSAAEVTFVKTFNEPIKERFRNIKDNPRRKSDIEFLSTSNSMHITTPNNSNKSKEIRRMSATESPTDSSNSSGNTSPNSENIINPQELQLMKWYLQRIRIPNTDLSDIKTSLGDVNEEDIIDDPRLTVGMRAKYLGFLSSKKNENTSIEETTSIKKRESKNIPLNRTGTLRRSSESSDSDVIIINEPKTYEGKSTASKHHVAPKMSFTTGVANMPNIKITIQNSTENMDNGKERQIGMHLPLTRNVHQLHGHLINEKPIPKDARTDEDICYEKLLIGLTRKHRDVKDSIPPEKFISHNLLSQWDRIVMFDLKNCQNELIRELNKYETKPYPFGCNYYLRSSLRMVEIDYRTNQQFSDPTDTNGEKLLTNDDMLYFVDLAGAPGGVVEYFHKRRRLRNKGFGVTYKKRAYDVSKIPDTIPEFFEAFYGRLNSYAGDGSLFCKDTVDTFVKHVLDATEGKGVHIVTTIGNITKLVFDDRNDEKWKYQHLAQMLVGLKVLREGGNMAFKMFELKTCFTVGLVYLLYRCFKSVTISKLNIFAPTSSERVVVCLGKRSKDEIEGVLRFLNECHKDMTDWYDAKKKGFRSNRTIEELIPFSKLEENKEFMKYIRSSNDSIKENQIEELKACIKNLKASDFKSMFTNTSFKALVTRTTDLWKIPTSMKKPKRQIPRSKTPTAAISEMRILPECVEGVESILNEFNLYTILSIQRNWMFVPVGNTSRNRGFYMGVNGSPYFFSMKIRHWVSVDCHNFPLPDKTLVFGEFVTLYENDNRPFCQIFTVIDGVYLAGESIQHLSYQERIAECSHFCAAASRIFFPRTAPQLTVTTMFECSQLPNFLDLVVPFSADQLRIPAHIVYKLPNFLSKTASNYWFKPSGMLFFESDLDLPDACQILTNRVYWEWVPGMDIPLPKPSVFDALNDSTEECRPIGSVSARKITNFINRYSKS